MSSVYLPIDVYNFSVFDRIGPKLIIHFIKHIYYTIWIGKVISVFQREPYYYFYFLFMPLER